MQLGSDFNMLETLTHRVNWPLELAIYGPGPDLWLFNLSPVAHHRSSGQTSKDGRFEDASNMENALMQQPSHMHGAEGDYASVTNDRS